MIGFQVIEIMASFAEMLIGIWVNVELLSKSDGKRKKIVGAAVIVAFIIWLLNQYKLFSVFTSAVAILGIMTGAYIICKVRILDSLVLTVFFMVLLYIVDFLSISIFGMIYQEEQLAQIIASETSIERAYLLVFSKALLAGISYWLVKKCLCKVNLAIRKVWIGVLLCCFFLLYLVRSTYSEVDTDVFLAWIFFLVVVVLAIYSVVQYFYYMQEKNRLSLAIERNNMQLDAYYQLIRDSQEKQMFYHDLKNQYLIIENYLKNKEYVKAEAYMQKLNTENLDTLYKHRTGIQAVDILLNYKMKEAESHQIRVDTDIDVVSLKMPEQDLIALLGNALDNAIEACKKMTGGMKWVRITIQKMNEMTLIKISNSYEQHPVEKFGQLVSSKDNPQVHGLGIKSMRAIAEQYDGKLKIDYANGEFCVIMSFFN